ncbi:MAG: permease-like cell division protein FtsX [Lachnospiraceae bacterium]|nr:permease-like cell division protein FtsX [Lachnospiraceae bacterium]
MTEQEIYKKTFLPLHAEEEISLKRENTVFYTKVTGRKIKTACACVLGMLLLCNTTCYAAYQIYQTKHLTIFFEEGISQSEIDEIGKELNRLGDCAEIELQMEYVNADQAWETFCNEYLDDDVKEKFDDNPLKDSANYQVTIKFFSNTDNVRKQIENIPGVRMVVDKRENAD